MRAGSELAGTINRHSSRMGGQTGQRSSHGPTDGTLRYGHSSVPRRWEPLPQQQQTDVRDFKGASRSSVESTEQKEKRKYVEPSPTTTTSTTTTSAAATTTTTTRSPTDSTAVVSVVGTPESLLAQQMRRLLDSLEFLRQAHTVFDAQQQTSYTASTLRLSDLGYRYHWRRILNSENLSQLAPYELLLAHALSNHGAPPNVASLSSCIEELEMFCYVNTSEVERRQLHAASSNTLALNDCLLNTLGHSDGGGEVDHLEPDEVQGDAPSLKDEKGSGGRKRGSPGDSTTFDDKKQGGKVKEGKTGNSKKGAKTDASNQPRKSARLQQARLAAKQSVHDLDDERIPTQPKSATTTAIISTVTPSVAAASAAAAAAMLSAITALPAPVANVSAKTEFATGCDEEPKANPGACPTDSAVASACAT